MIIITRANITDAELDAIRERIEARGMRTHLSRGEQRTIIGCIGDESLLDEVPLRSLPGVEDVMPVLKPYKLASREFAAAPVVRVGERSATSVGGRAIAVIAGPCSVENREMLPRPRSAVRARRHDAARRRIQAAHVAVRFQGLGSEALECSPRCAPRRGCRSSPR